MLIVGFNSQNYDLNILKACLVRSVDRFDGGFSFVVKKCQSMSCMQSNRLRFLDACNCIASEYTYDKYLQADGVEQWNKFFSYEWMDTVNKLDNRKLPPQKAFYSILRRKGISDDNYDTCKTF